MNKGEKDSMKRSLATLAVVSLDKSQVRPIGSGEIAHARQVAAA